jgi:protein-tyrosine kinase
VTQVSAIQPAPPRGSEAHASEREGGLPVTFSPDLVTLLNPMSASAESIRALRTHVLTQHIHLGRRALAVCATSLGAGCTFVAANLAVALAQAGLQVLLIDADLREPGIDAVIKPDEPLEGLAHCLAASELRPLDYIQTDVLPGLSVLFAGRPSVHAQELLSTDHFERVVNTCLRDYDVTIIDTPPANTFSDVRRVASVAGYALVVARRNRSLVPDVRVLTDQLESDNAVVIGTVLNA